MSETTSVARQAAPVAVVTGAAKGLGAAIAEVLVDAGHRVYVTDVDDAGTQLVADRLGPTVSALPLDVGDPAACRAVVAEVLDREGRLDAWFNNAGILETGPVWAQDDTRRAATIDVNVHGTINGTLAALDAMRSAGAGHVVNIVSLAGLVATPGMALYGASKHACLAFSLGALHDLRRSGFREIHVSALCPDGIWTPMLLTKAADPEAALSWSGRLLEPPVVARAAVALLDRPRPVTSLPRHRGVLARTTDLWPRLGLATSPLVLAGARRRQRAFKRDLDDKAITALKEHLGW